VPQEVLENIPRDRFDRLMLPSDWAKRMDVLSRAYQNEKEIMTIGIPGQVALLNVTVPNVSLDEAAKYMTMKAKLRLETYRIWPEEAFFCFFEADIRSKQPDSSVRTKDLMNAYRAHDDNDKELWGVKDSAREYLSELSHIANNSGANATNPNAKYLAIKSKAYKSFCKYNAWLTSELQQKQAKLDIFRPPDPSVYVCDETGDIECHAEPVG